MFSAFLNAYSHGSTVLPLALTYRYCFTLELLVVRVSDSARLMIGIYHDYDPFSLLRQCAECLKDDEHCYSTAMSLLRHRESRRHNAYGLNLKSDRHTRRNLLDTGW